MDTLLTQPTLCKSVFAAEERPYGPPLVASTKKVQRYPWVAPFATGSFTLSVIAFTSAYPLAFPEALAS